MEQFFELQEREKGDVVILDLQGSLTIGANEQLVKNTVSDLLDGGYKKIVVNLKDLEFIDSSGVGALVKSYTTVTNSGGRMKLLQLSKNIRHVLNITGLLGIFEVHEEEDKAIASF